MKNQKLRTMIAVAMLASISFVLMLFNFPLPALPEFLRIDFSDVPALVAAISMGPAAGVAVALVKNVLDWLFQGSPTGVPVGHLANFATSMLFVLPVYALYRRMRSTKGLLAALAVGTASMTIGMTVLNHFVFLPMYTYFMNFPAMTGEARLAYLLAGVVPFNLIKGAMLTALIAMLMRILAPWIERQRAHYMLAK